MILLVTGATGFVMSNLVRHWLELDPANRAIAVDASAPDSLARDYFAPVAARLEIVTADILDDSLWASLASREPVDFLVHGATVTSIERHVHAAGPARPGLAGAIPSIDINIGGTLKVLTFAQSLPALRCLVNVSSGSVYGDTGPADRPLPEDGYLAPDGIYAITKYSCELFNDYCARALGLPAVSVRLSGVFGAMDRRTPGRDVTCVPKAIVQRALAAEPVRVRALDGVGDFIQAGDVATAIVGLLTAPRRRHQVYNVAAGALASVGELLDYTREVIPDLRVATGGEQLDVDYDPARRTGRWGAYDISRIRADTGWAPRPLRDTMHEYIDWIRRTGP